jgi:hypothetical protein
MRISETIFCALERDNIKLTYRSLEPAEPKATAGQRRVSDTRASVRSALRFMMNQSVRYQPVLSRAPTSMYAGQKRLDF